MVFFYFVRVRSYKKYSIRCVHSAIEDLAMTTVLQEYLTASDGVAGLSTTFTRDESRRQAREQRLRR